MRCSPRLPYTGYLGDVLPDTPYAFQRGRLQAHHDVEVTAEDLANDDLGDACMATAVSSAAPAARRPRPARHRDGRASVPADMTLIGRYFRWVSTSIREGSRGSCQT
ncbi:hypothetical protein ADK35_38890 [Streptomyces viridochromogenes]|nr:hypothetical protein ADK35_38890 [Streptomyces viridochromogenes]KOG18173.1 hypothetical protein ADK36_23390 [Streptomyces viridochromogenes]